jgi:hypothetical protein
MTTRKVILISLVLPVFYPVLILRDMLHKDVSEWAIGILVGVSIWAAGLLIGLLLTVIFKRQKAEPYFYLGSQLIFPLMIFGLVINARIDQTRHKRDYGNVDDNHSLLDIGRPTFGDSLASRMRPIQTAFVKLESSFADPNSFVLTRYKSYWQDTVIGQRYDTVYTVYFDYLKGKDEKYARLTVLGDTAVIDSADVPGRVGVYPGRHLDVRGRSLSQ